MPTVMAREWHDEVSVASHARPLFANSRVTRRLVSLPFSAVQLVGLELSWCRCRCRTFLEYGPLRPEASWLPRSVLAVLARRAEGLQLRPCESPNVCAVVTQLVTQAVPLSTCGRAEPEGI